MKRLFILIISVLPGFYLSAQTLFTYGKHKVDKEEFLRAFYKNNTGDNNEASLRTYLDLFIAFKLKVQAAKDNRIDTLASQKSDLLNFRQQIEADYLTDKNVIHKLVMEAFHRSQKDIRISHIFIPFDLRDNSHINPGDTSAAFEQINKAYAELNKGSDFSEVAVKYSSDPAVKSNKGDIGFITVFSLPYELESIAYTLPNNTFSPPYKSSAGYHILKKTGERPAWGRMSAAQILLAYAPSASPEEKQMQKKLADSLYRALRRGSDFPALAKQFSSERNAYATGGLLPEFGVGRYDPVFENAVFSLKKDGDISAPFETDFGIHIVKRIKHFPVSADSTAAETLFKDEVSHDARVRIAREQFTRRIINTVGYKKQFLQDQLLWSITDSFLWTNNFIPLKNITEKTVLFSLDKESKTVKDWLGFILSVKNKYTLPFPYADLMKQFVSSSAIADYQAHLEDYNTDFRNQLTEFSEGNLLFEIMEQQVWSKAAEDKNGLRQYYEQHKEKYTWGPSANAIFFTTSSRETAEEVSRDIIGYSRKWKVLGESTSGRIIADSSRFELEQIPGSSKTIQPGQITTLITDSVSGSTSFMYILAVHHQPAQRSFEEARGLVINDYQVLLEEEWLNRLKKKYPVKINEKLLHTLAK